MTNLNALIGADSSLSRTLANLRGHHREAQRRSAAPSACCSATRRDAQRIVTTLERTNALLARLDGLAGQGRQRRCSAHDGVMPEVARHHRAAEGAARLDARASLKKVDAILDDAQAIARQRRERHRRPRRAARRSRGQPAQGRTAGQRDQPQVAVRARDGDQAAMTRRLHPLALAACCAGAAAARLREQPAHARLAAQRAGRARARPAARTSRGDTAIAEARVRPRARRDRAHRPRRPAGARRADALRRARRRAWRSSPARRSTRCAPTRRPPSSPTPPTWPGAARRPTCRSCRRTTVPWPRRAPPTRRPCRRCSRCPIALSRQIGAAVLLRDRARQPGGHRAGDRHRVGARLAPPAAGVADAAGATRRRPRATPPQPTRCAGASR